MTTATAKQVAFYTAVVNDCVALDPKLGEISETAIREFPNWSTARASEHIERALATRDRLRKENPDAAKAADSLAERFPIWPGRYTIEKADGSHRTFKVIVQPSDADFAPGKAVIEYLSGPNNKTDYVGFAFLDGTTVRPWKRFAGNTELLADAAVFVADPDAALKSKHCARCGEDLTVPLSVGRGFGPTCWTKGLR